MQLLAVDTIIENVTVEDYDKKKQRYLFKWGNSMWEQIRLPFHECCPNNPLKIHSKGRLVQVDGKYYKHYVFQEH